MRKSCKYQYTSNLISKNNIDQMTNQEINMSFALIALNECIKNNNFFKIPTWIELLPRECQDEAVNLIYYYQDDDYEDNIKSYHNKIEINTNNNDIKSILKKEKNLNQNKSKKNVRFKIQKNEILHSYIQ